MNTSTVIEFGETRLCLQEAQARYQLTERLLHFVRNGLADFDGRVKLDLSAFQGAIASRFADTLSSAWSNPAVSGEQARKNAQAAFEALYQELAQRFDCPAVAPDVMGWGREQALADSDSDPDQEDPGTVQDALRIARENRQRMQSRVLTLYCLGALVPRLTESSAQQTAAAQAYNQASEFLWRQVQRFDKDVLMFSILVGGAALEACRAEIVRSTLTPGHSIIQYLSDDGRIPSRWHTGVETRFFDSLQALVAAPLPCA